MGYLAELILDLEKKELMSPELQESLIQFDEKYRAKYKKSDPNQCSFGKYKGKSWADIVRFDQPYVQWISRQAFLRPEQKIIIDELLSGV